MEIKNLVGELNPYSKKRVEQTERNRTEEAKSAKTSTSTSDTVSLSDEAKLRGVAHTEAMKSDGVRAEKVAELKARVQAGTYEPDTRKAAQNLVRDDLDLLI